MKKKFVFIIWILLVTIWNFGYPQATPFLDVIVAIILSFFSMGLNYLFITFL